MFKGFYNLASSMITRNQNLNVISNNLVNSSTPGYKADTYMSRTFRDEVFYRMGHNDSSDQQQIGTVSMARVGDGTITNYEEGGLKETGSNLDFAISGQGFFKVARPDGTFCYTRNGSFNIDEDGNLVLQGIGIVQGEGGDINLESDEITFNSSGGIVDKYGDDVDTLQLVDFEDYTQFTKGANGTFTTAQEEQEVESPSITNGYLESSNVDTLKEMTEMITSQRTIQSAAQLLKIYDQMMGKASTDIGKV